MNNDPNEKAENSNLDQVTNNSPQMMHPAGATITPSNASEGSTMSTPEEVGDGLPQNPIVATPTEETQLHMSPKKSKKKLLIAIGAVVAVVAVAAGAWYFLSGNKEEKETQTAVVYNDITVLRVGDTNGPIGVDTIFPNAPAAQASQQIDFQVYEGLVGYSDQKIVPLLATSWTNPDNNTWVFTLKEGVTFHSGKTVTAQDVKTSLDELKEADYWGGFLYTIDTVTVGEDNKVTIKTTSPDSLLLNRLVYGFVYSKNADETYSGTGAYTVDVENSKTESATKLLAYDNYHQGKPKTRAVEYTIYGDYDAVIKDLKDGKLDTANSFKNTTEATELTQVGFAGYDYASSGVYGISLNMVKDDSPLQKLEVRQALAYALDRETYVKSAQSDSVGVTYIIPKTVVGYDDAATVPAFDATKVKDLLTKAGYPNGVDLEFSYIEGIQADVPALIEVLNKNGFTVTAKSYPSPREFVQAGSSGNYDMLAGRFSTDLGDGLDTFSSLLGTDTSQFPSYSNPDFDKMLSEAAAAFKPEEHVQKVQEINKYATDNLLYIPVSNTEFTIYYPKDTNYTVDGLQAVTGMYYWKLGKAATATTN
jgi:peptide/nickel transport system substrate-binding protein